LRFLSGTERRHGLTPIPDKKSFHSLLPAQGDSKIAAARAGRSGALTDFTTADALYVNCKLQFARLKCVKRA
jgi:hypothetical protein